MPEMLGFREAENATPSSLIVAGLSRWEQQSTAECWNEFRFSETAGVPAKEASNWRIEGEKREGLPGRNTEDC